VSENGNFSAPILQIVVIYIN